MTHPFAFLLLAATLVAIPGPAVTLVMRHAVTAGRRQAIVVATGVLAADAVWMAASAAGVTAVLVASRPAFDALRLLGAAYLVWLGIGLLRRPGFAEAGARRPQRRHAFRDGVLCDLSNPKTALVFTSIVPQFVDPDAGAAGPLAAGVAFALLGFLSLLVYAVVFDRGARAIRPRVRRVLLRVSGGLLVAFGIRLAADVR